MIHGTGTVAEKPGFPNRIFAAGTGRDTGAPRQSGKSSRSVHAGRLAALSSVQMCLAGTSIRLNFLWFNLV